MGRAIARFIYFKILGWKLHGDLPDLDKCVIAVAPHTSWIDFALGLLVRKVVGKKVNYIGKKSLFKPPFGWFFRWTGGAPVDRVKKEDTVSQVVQLFRQRKVFRFALAPEGTRKKVNTWRTGFYHIALAAGVPIILIAFDFGKKEVKISEPYYPTGNIEEDLKLYWKFYEGVKGLYPERSFID